MVQVQSTWFPLVDRNPQKFVPDDIFEADGGGLSEGDAGEIWRTAEYPSNVEIPVVVK